jgi:hypothetical protein
MGGIHLALLKKTAVPPRHQPDDSGQELSPEGGAFKRPPGPLMGSRIGSFPAESAGRSATKQESDWSRSKNRCVLRSANSRPLESKAVALAVSPRLYDAAMASRSGETRSLR